jgi:DNA polymerase
MQFRPALDQVLVALERMREQDRHAPAASRQMLRRLWETPVGDTNAVAAVTVEAGGSKRDLLRAIEKRVSVCLQCPHLASSRTQTVFGVGNPDADLMFIGEAPGADEDRKGEPFVGRAGQLLTRIIQTMGLSRDKVYIANILKCRPDTPGASSGNRPPTPAEMQTCLPYLVEQISIVRPKVLVALGATAVEGLLGERRTMRDVRGTWHSYAETPLMITYHPSYLLRNQTLSEKRKVWEDMLQVMERLERPISEKQKNYFLKAEA